MKNLSVPDFVDSLITQAINEGVSDIHLDPSEGGLRIRFRVDGFLLDKGFVEDLTIALQIVSRIKVLSNLDIAKRRVPQDGKFYINFDNRKVDLRVSTFPSTLGEKCVVRILDGFKQFITLDDIGLNAQHLGVIKSLILKNQGLILVTGPTGAGKTTTLYSIISAINSNEKNIITLEDPVEYHIEGITQGQINYDSGFTFAKGIRSMLRQDPDVVMVGEIRDRESAQIAMEASLTGHLVLSTLHTNDAPSAVIRLLEMNVEPYLINSSLLAVVAQRLARKVCSLCKALSPDCKDCNNGLKGRMGVFEILTMEENIKNLVKSNCNLSSLRDAAIKNGMINMTEDGIKKVKSGSITQEELSRILN